MSKQLNRLQAKLKFHQDKAAAIQARIDRIVGKEPPHRMEHNADT